MINQLSILLDKENLKDVLIDYDILTKLSILKQNAYKNELQKVNSADYLF